MLIKEQKYRTCKSCQARHSIGEEVYGCDTCRKEIDLNKKGVEYLDATVFRHNGEAAKHMQFCSWKCAMKSLRKVKSDYFISLPFLQYDSSSAGLRAHDFFALLKR